MNIRLAAAVLAGLVLALVSRKDLLGLPFRRLDEVRLEDLCGPPPLPNVPECPAFAGKNCACDQDGAPDVWASALPKDRQRRRTFESIFASKQWGDTESRSGPGSSVPYTANVRRLLASAWKTLKIRTFLDAPCGDAHWISKTAGFKDVSYTGADIVPAAAVLNSRQYRHQANMRFMQLDLVGDELPSGQDMVLVRDVLQHLPLKDGMSMIRNIERSGVKFLVTNWHILSEKNRDVKPGEWFMVDLFQPPYNFSLPLFYIVDGPDSSNEKGVENYKLMGVFRLPVLGKGDGKRFRADLKTAMKDIVIVDPAVKLEPSAGKEQPVWMPEDPVKTAAVVMAAVEEMENEARSKVGKGAVNEGMRPAVEIKGGARSTWEDRQTNADVSSVENGKRKSGVEFAPVSD